jgi:hypothetical protein
VDFGDRLTVPAGAEFHLAFTFESLAGIRSVELISAGESVAHRTFVHDPQRTRADFTLRAERPGWYALVIEDAQGRKAYSNPIWVELTVKH